MRLVHSEWTRFRTVPGWLRGIIAAGLLVLLFPLTGLGGSPAGSAGPVPIGPDGTPVVDAFYFVHHPLTGDGSLTIKVSQLTGDGESLAPWAKAGLMMRSGLGPGARYAALMVTGGHGVRLQHDYLYDRPAPAGPWLRLSRSGPTVTASVSSDGHAWVAAGSVRLPGPVLEAGLFVASPPRVNGAGTAPTGATARFDGPSLGGAGEQIGGRTATFGGGPPGGSTRSGGGLVVTGTGDLAPATRSDLPIGVAAGDLLLGTFPALIVVVVVAALMMTTDHRRGLLRITLSATPGRSRVLVARAGVLAAVTLVAGLAGTLLAVPLWSHVVRHLGAFVFPAPAGVLLRAEAGTAAVLALTAVLALSIGSVVRRSAPAVAAVVVVTVLPYLLALTPFLPPALPQWLTRFTPAAAFAVQQTVVRYPQVDSVWSPANGYYPLSPRAGLAVLGGYTAVAFALAVALLRRWDA